MVIAAILSLSHSHLFKRRRVIEPLIDNPFTFLFILFQAGGLDLSPIRLEIRHKQQHFLGRVYLKRMKSKLLQWHCRNT